MISKKITPKVKHFFSFSNAFIVALSISLLFGCQLNNHQKSDVGETLVSSTCSLKGPVELAIDVETPNSGLGQNVAVTVTIHSAVDLQDAKLILSSEGGINLDSETNIPAITADNPYVFTANAGLNALGDNTIKASVTGNATNQGSIVGMKLNKYGFVESNRSFFSYGSSESVKRIRLKYMKENNEISNKEFKGQIDELKSVRLIPTVKKKGTNTKSSNINISGTIRWQDGAGNFHSLPSAEVEIYDGDLIFDDLLASVTTNSMGQYSANVDEQLFDDLDIFVRVYARNTTNGFYVVPGETSGSPMSFSDAYFGEFSAGEVTVDTDISFDILNTNDAGQAFSLHHGLVMCTDYINTLTNSYLSILAIEFPGIRTTGAGTLAGAFYNGGVGLIHMPDANDYDWDVLHHEYGHHVMNVFNFEENPGGPHSIGQHLSDDLGKNDGVKLAWAEGYPTYFGLSLQQEMSASTLNIAFVGDLNYTDTRFTPNLDYNIEENILLVSEGEDDEVAVQKILWDIYDSNSDGVDGLSLGHSAVWNIISPSGAVTLSDAWGAFINGKSAEETQDYAKIFTNFKVSPEPTAPDDEKEVKGTDAPVTFTWDANGGGGTCCPNDEFTVAFYNEDFSTKIFESAKLTTNTYTPSTNDWETIINPVNAPIINWIVKGSSTTAPVTGIYSSTARKIKLERSVDIAFIIDDTGSMEEEIGGVRNGLQTIISNFNPEDGTIFQLTTFKDNFTVRSSTDDLSVIQGQVASLFAVGGDECPEASIEAAIAAIEGVRNGGTIFIATDAAPHPGIDINPLIAKATSRNITISIILSGDCTEVLAFAPQGNLMGMEESIPISYNEQNEVLNAASLLAINDLTAIEAFSTIASETGGIFLFVPQVNDGTFIGEQFFENSVVNIINGTLTLAIIATQPPSGPAGGTLAVQIIGSNTNFDNTTTLAFGGSGVNILNTNVLSPTVIQAVINIDTGASLGLRDVSAITGVETATGLGVFQITNGSVLPTVIGVSPPSATQGTSIDLTIFGSNTNFTNVSEVFLGSGITVTAINAVDANTLIATIDISDDASVGFRDVSVLSTGELASESVIGPFFITTATCNNNVQDGNEEGIDCGGDCPFSCELIASCSNGIQDGNEADIDCGGDCPFSCELIASCSNGLLDGNETGIDCGGSCPNICATCDPDGGIIATSDATTICTGNGIDDFIDLTLTDNTGTNSQWVITDATGVILDLPAAPPFNFENVNGGICLIWHLAYEDGLTGTLVGNNATTDLAGCYDLSNSIEVIRNEVDGGMLSINGNTGETMTAICIDGIPDLIDVAVGGTPNGSNFAWVITDDNLNILALPTAPPFDLDGAGVGTCLIWYLAYEDGLTGAVVGENAANLTGCFDLSDPITVTRTCCDDMGNPSDCPTECENYTLDFEDHDQHWYYNSRYGTFVDGEQTFDIHIDNDDHILRHTYESHSGLAIGIEPHDVHDELAITYELSEVASSVVFDIVDLDYKTGGSKQQEAVCIYGLLGNDNTQILPMITSLEGGVSIDGNCAEATTNSAVSGEDESILVEFTECIDQIVIIYGTGSNSPTHNPDYSKIFIGKDLGFSTEVCGDCPQTQECADETLDFEEHGVRWHNYATSGSYDLGSETVDIEIGNDDHVLTYTTEDDKGVKVAMNPHDTGDEVIITYNLSDVSDNVVFDIEDLDYKTGGSRQQEAVCVYGLLGEDDTQILPTFTSLEGSVMINGNCAEATTNSAVSGKNESVLVEFTECIDQVIIIYGTGSNSPTHNPSHSSITIGETLGFTAEFCSEPCESSGSGTPREDLSNANITIFPNPTGNASLVTVSIECGTKGDAELLITDALGRYVAQMPITLNGNITNYRFDTNRLNAGVYLVQIRTDKWQSRTQRMVVINR